MMNWTDLDPYTEMGELVVTTQPSKDGPITTVTVHLGNQTRSASNLSPIAAVAEAMDEMLVIHRMNYMRDMFRQKKGE